MYKLQRVCRFICPRVGPLKVGVNTLKPDIKKFWTTDNVQDCVSNYSTTHEKQYKMYTWSFLWHRPICSDHFHLSPGGGVSFSSGQIYADLSSQDGFLQCNIGIFYQQVTLKNLFPPTNMCYFPSSLKMAHDSIGQIIFRQTNWDSKLQKKIIFCPVSWTNWIICPIQ